MMLQFFASIAATHTLRVESRPDIACTFNTNGVELEANKTVSLSAYTQTGFKFLRWEDESGATVSTQSYFTYTMPDRDVLLTAVCEYNPANPANPAKNYWNKETGEVIIDDFTPGSLSSAISSAISGSNRNDVKSIIVSGVVTNNDLGIANNYSQCSFLDLSRVTGITDIPSYAFDYTNLETVILPHTIEKIGYEAFYQCTSLTALTVYAMTPPTLEYYVFYGVPEGLVVYVPAAAIPQYEEAEVWKDFIILPIQEDIRNITVSLPNGTNVADFAQMWLELANTKSGQRIHYVMTDRQTYTFANIIRNTSWKVTIRNERGDVFGQIDKVEVKDEDVAVSFTSLSKPQTVSLTVLLPDGTDVTDKAQVTWLDAEGSYLTQSYSLVSLPSGSSVSYRVMLSQELAMQYVTPAVAEYVVNNSNNHVQIKLEPIKQITLSGSVKDAATNMALNGAIITASQTFDGKYNKTVSTKTDTKGNYSLTVSSVPTSLAFSASNYISQTIVCDTLMTGDENISLPDVSLKSISGAVIALNLTYTKCPTETGDEDTFQDWYADYNNITYSIYNQTKQKNINEFNVQYPQIVLLEEVEEGDVLQLTATSVTGAFMPVRSSATIDKNQHADAVFNIVELGKIRATFAKNSNATVVGSLYDANGKLVKTYDYSNASLTINDLPDGSYTLVTMGSSKLFNSIYDLNQFSQTGLVRGTDYTQASANVQSGKVCAIDIDQVPTLNESKLYYTGENTSFTVNKSSIVAGNYLTLTGHLDFKSAYAGNVSNVNLIVDLPESCEFVENSVMVGNNTSSYTLQNNRITIPMARYSDRVRFCVIPTLGGEYAPSALAQFDIDDETITQPIGSANYTVKDLSISVPTTVAKTTIPVSGTAVGVSTVEIYDGDALIGQTTSLANGTWSTTCELNEPYNLSEHAIYAKVMTKTGMSLKTETKKCGYDCNVIEAKTVTMSFYNNWLHKNVEVVFDLQNQSVNATSYMFYTTTDITFAANLTNNDTTNVRNVTIRAYTSQGNWRNIDAIYDSDTDRWVAVSSFGSDELPVGVDVIVDAKNEKIADRKKIDVDLSTIDILFSEVSDNMRNINELLTAELGDESAELYLILENYLENEDYNVSEVNNWIESVRNYQTSGDTITDEIAEELTLQYQHEFEELTYQLKNSQDSSIYALFYLPEDVNQLSPSQEDSSFEYNGYNYAQKKWVPVNIDELLNEGFMSCCLTDSSKILFKYDDLGFIIIDTEKGIEYNLMPISQAESIARFNLPRNALSPGYKECVESWSTLIANIIGYKNIEANIELKNLVTIVRQLLGTISGVIDACTCYYRGYYLEFEYRINNVRNNTIKKIDTQIEANRQLIDKHWERILVQNKMISEQQEIILVNQQRINELYAQAITTTDPQELKNLERQIDNCEELIKVSEDHIKMNKKIISDINNKDIRQINKQLNNLAKEKEAVEDGFKLAKKALNKIPSTLSTGTKASIGTKIGKLAGPLGTLCDVIDIYVTASEAYEEIDQWIDLSERMLRKLPCEGDPSNAESLAKEIRNNFIGVITTYASILGTKGAAVPLHIIDVPVFTPQWWIAAGLDIYAEWINYLLISNHFIPVRGDFYLKIRQLKCSKEDEKCPICNKKPCECEDNCPKCGKKPCACNPPEPTVDPIHDPSGYVYEAISSNRLQGVTATVFYKEYVEDMYGDLYENIVKWDAEVYAQENPLFTDEFGMYAWDVPQGLWQVKFEKEGYETTYSEWLPVPPPQLDVNIAMTQNRQPEVKMAHAYEGAVEVEFDKYMMPELLNTDNIIVMQGNKQVAGSVELLNEEVSYEGSDETFASKVRFNAAAPFSEQEVTLIVNNRVKSYAGIRMQDNFQQTFTVEKEIKQIVCDSLNIVGYGEETTLTISVLPAIASKGKTLSVQTSSAMILGIDTDKIVIDNEGKAEINATGYLPGVAGLTISVEGTDKTATAIVKVIQPSAEVAMPKASILSGSVIARGTSIVLSCTTADATIYYTLDGSCPCDEDSRLLYTGPIVINRDLTIKAMAIGPDGKESEIAEFTYFVDGSGIENIFEDSSIRIYPSPVEDYLTINAHGQKLQAITLTSMNGATIIFDNLSDDQTSIDVHALPSGPYVIEVFTDAKSTNQIVIKK